MTTASLQLKVQRSRFAHHALAAIAAHLPESLRSLAGSPRPARSLTESETAAREAQQVRKMAYAYSQTDPGFSADLYAAAARHEGLHAE